MEKDIRNNSAWNQRYFAIFHNPTKPSEEFLGEEVQYGISKIKLTPNNISPWNYVKGVIAKSKLKIDVLEELCKSLYQQDIISPHALGCLVDIYEDRVKCGSINEKELGIQACVLLAEQHDTIRQKYWNYRKHVLASIA
ncbi:14912_t:CDS:2 [Dentiscutata heterogama]|uniref:14912_t:CDS:1 n=1 Tax=Dentiscutata heterogama TaxID=1316150 RepID=A0ACA9KWP9_9GLOM|nr:14912_t:CDS:2 [Dentiscutata heterogama]